MFGFLGRSPSSTVWGNLIACLWQMHFHSSYEMPLTYTVMFSVTPLLHFFILFSFPVHVITYPQTHSSSAQSHSLNNNLRRTCIIELYWGSKFRKIENWCVNNILWWFLEPYFPLWFSLDAKGQEIDFLCTLLLLEVMVSNLNFPQWGEFCDNIIIRE